MSRLNSSLPSRLVIVLLASMVGMTMPAADNRMSPRLVVGIVVDGLQADYINNLRDYFSEGGFKRLLRDGVVITNADYGTSLDPVAASAMLMTGASPSVNGISGEFIYDVDGHRLKPTLFDENSIGNFTDETYSPRNLLVSNIADEVRIAGGGVTNVFAIAPDVQQAIILGGHAANSVFWINDTNGNWATTTFYKDVPTIIGGRNRLAPLATRLDTMSWTPLLPIVDYPDLPDHLKRYPFRYVFPQGKEDRYAVFKNSAPVNNEVTTLAIDFINTLGLGKHDGTDMLNLAYTLAPFDYTNNTDSRLEQMDSYLRLDRNLEQLFAGIDRATGGNSVIFLVATPPSSTVRRDDERWNIPYGEFSTRKAGSLLNMYLMALYGTGEWVSGYHNGHFFLNNRLIKDKNLDAKAIRSEAALFIARMSGVKEVYTIDQILAGNVTDKANALRRNTHIRTAGDIYVNVIPGWQIVNDFDSSAGSKANNRVERIAATTAPAFSLAPNISPRQIDIPVDVRVIIPTVSRLLRIRSPNAVASAALPLN